MKKFGVMLIVCFLLTIILSACNQRSEYELNPDQLIDFPINNSIDIFSSQMISYSLNDLNNFFGEYSSQERSVFSKIEKQKESDIKSIDKSFPIEVLRHNKNSYYTVYKVSEGGFYYVFWMLNNSQFIVSDTFYICQLKSVKDFSNLEIGKSSYADVYRIDPSCELIVLLSNGVYSYSLLDNGKIMEIEYSFHGDIQDRKDFIISSLNIVSEKHEYGSHLQYILKKDLPH